MMLRLLTLKNAPEEQSKGKRETQYVLLQYDLGNSQFVMFSEQQEKLCVVPCSLSETITFGWFVFCQPILDHISPPTQAARRIRPAFPFAII